MLDPTSKNIPPIYISPSERLIDQLACRFPELFYNSAIPCCLLLFRCGWRRALAELVSENSHAIRYRQRQQLREQRGALSWLQGGEHCARVIALTGGKRALDRYQVS